MTTHLACDLLSYRTSLKLQLLESHTGELKKRLVWNTKYKKITTVELNNLPFNEKLLYILGDNTGMVQPLNIKIRRALGDVATSNNWTPNTTVDRVVFDTNKSDIVRPALGGYRSIKIY